MAGDRAEAVLRLAVEDALAGDGGGPPPRLLATALVRIELLDPELADAVLDGWEDARALRGAGDRRLRRNVGPASPTPTEVGAVALAGEVRTPGATVAAHGLIWLDDAVLLLASVEERRTSTRVRRPLGDPRFEGLQLRSDDGEHDLLPTVEVALARGHASVVQLLCVPPPACPPGPLELAVARGAVELVADPAALAVVRAAGLEPGSAVPSVRAERVLRQLVEQAAASGAVEPPPNVVALARALDAAGLGPLDVPTIPKLGAPGSAGQVEVTMVGRALPLVDGLGVALLAIQRHATSWCLWVQRTGDTWGVLPRLHWRVRADDGTLHVGRTEVVGDDAVVVVAFGEALPASARVLEVEAEGPRSTAWATVELP